MKIKAKHVLRKHFPQPDDLIGGRVEDIIIKAMEEYAKTVASNAFGDGWDKCLVSPIGWKESEKKHYLDKL